MTPEEFKWASDVARAACDTTPHNHAACGDIRKLANLALAEAKRADALIEERMMVGYSVGAMLEGGQQAMKEDRDKVALLALENGQLRAAAREKLAHDRSEHHGGRCQKCFDVDAKMEAALNARIK